MNIIYISEVASNANNKLLTYILSNKAAIKRTMPINIQFITSDIKKKLQQMNIKVSPVLLCNTNRTKYVGIAEVMKFLESMVNSKKDKKESSKSYDAHESYAMNILKSGDEKDIENPGSDAANQAALLAQSKNTTSSNPKNKEVTFADKEEIISSSAEDAESDGMMSDYMNDILKEGGDE